MKHYFLSEPWTRKPAETLSNRGEALRTNLNKKSQRFTIQMGSLNVPDGHHMETIDNVSFTQWI